MKTILFIFASFLLAGEMELDGNLKVTGNIDANGNTITNVGSPINATDAVNLASIQGLGGMKPERIYRHIVPNNETFSFTVPTDKIWEVDFGGGLKEGNMFNYIEVNNTLIGLSNFAVSGGGYSQATNFKPIILLGGDTIDNITDESVNYSFDSGILIIYEYPISGSGTDQGMDYIEP